MYPFDTKVMDGARVDRKTRRIRADQRESTTVRKESVGHSPMTEADVPHRIARRPRGLPLTGSQQRDRLRSVHDEDGPSELPEEDVNATLVRTGHVDVHHSPGTRKCHKETRPGNAQRASEIRFWNPSETWVYRGTILKDTTPLCEAV